jgi:Zn-dependent protease/CBS domain-containing protein
MRGGFRVGRVFGIEIRVDWSWLLIAILITWNLATAFGDLHPDWGGGLLWGTAVVAALLFFGSVLAHELAHSVVARARGIPVRNITLFLFGGVSNIQREPPSPRAEFLMAIVGPLTSVVIGAALALAAGATVGSVADTINDPNQAISQLSPLTTLLLWLGSINVLLGAFNMIPGFPLDGGRVLRSVFWAATDNLRRATRWASSVGQGIAWLMIVGGVAMIFGVQLPVFGSGTLNGLWLVFIGWFLNNGATQSYRQVVIQDILDDVPVRRMMRTDPPTVSAGLSVADLVHEQIMKTDDHAFPVVEGNRLVGLVTLEDVRAISRSEWENTLVRDIMTPADKLVSVMSEEDAAEALQKLQQQDVRQLPVMQDGTLAGLLRRRDITKWLQLQSELELG